MLGRYTTGPVAARAEHSRCTRRCRRIRATVGLAATAPRGPDAADSHQPEGPPPSPILLPHGPHRPAQRHRHPADARRCAARWPTAEVGDDVFDDDPTIKALEARAAELLGKEAGLFVASGTMGNLVAQLAHLGRGQETIAGREHHMVLDEAAGHAVIVGTSIRGLADRPDGTLDPHEIEARSATPSDPHEPITGLITIENTHAHSMGQPLDARLHAGGRGDRPRPRRPAPHRRRPVLERGRRPGRDRARPGRSGRLGHVLPVEGAGLPGRLGRRRRPGVHPSGPSRPEARRRRHAPGRDPRRRRPRRARRTDRTA